MNLFAEQVDWISNVERTDVWLTPSFIIEALGGWESFDLDPCAPLVQPFPTAKKTYTEADNGLIQPWEGRIWLNPPYSFSLLNAFMKRMVNHHGTALIFARTDTDVFFKTVWEKASSVLFIRGRINFLNVEGIMSPNNAGAPSVLVGYGEEDTERLAARPIDGHFLPLRFQSSWLIDITAESWREVIERFFANHSGSVSLGQIYDALASHPKAKRNQHYQAKIRQVLQHGKYVNVGRGVWQREFVKS